MSVRMALAKLCACACGGAVVGGGAVHVAEHPHGHVFRQVAHHTTRHSIGPTRAGRRAIPMTAACAPAGALDAYGPAPMPISQGPGYSLDGGGTVIPATVRSGFLGGGGGRFLGGTSGGGGKMAISFSPSLSGTAASSPGVINAPVSGSSSPPGNGTSFGSAGDVPVDGLSNTSGTAGSSGDPSPNQTTGPSLAGSSSQDLRPTTSSTSSGGGAMPNGATGSASGSPAPVPAPPMVLLFGAAAAALVARKRFSRKIALVA